MRILLVEDDHALAQAMLDLLRQSQYLVDWVDDGQQALMALKEEHFDLAILDLTLPRIDGLEVLRETRQAGIYTPVIILTARTELGERLLGLDAGADDYLTKPFAMDELKARIRAVTRRGHPVSGDAQLHVGHLRLDTETGQLAVGDERAVLPRSEFQILYYLMRHPGRVATRRRLEEQLYGWESGVESNALEVHIHHLRRRVGKETIRTIRGVGYVLDLEPSAQASECP